MRVKFGDGSPAIERVNMDFGATGSAQWEVSHTYMGWLGLKTASAEGVVNCGGKVTSKFRVMRAQGDPVTLRQELAIGFGATAATCTAVPGVSALRAGTRVGIRANPDPGVKINFGCVFGCVYDADGIPGSVATEPFAGFRQLSLVLRVGTQIVQGGTGMSFVTNQTGPLELCVNDEKLSDNSGAWGLFISVDEPQEP